MIKCLLFNVVEFPYLSRSLGVYRIAHVLREQGLDVEVVDWSNFWSLDQLKELIISRDPHNIKLIGFGHMFSIWNDTLEQLCQWVKQQHSHINIISGSAVAPEFESKFIDYYIQGFGEHAITALVQYLLSNGPRPRFSLNKINGAHIIHANDTYPAFPMESLMVQYQDRDFLRPDEWLTIEFARGCKFSCDFCNFPVLGVKGDYSRSQHDFELQMRDTYDRFGIKNYIVADETFNDSTEKIRKFADVVEKLNFESFFSAFIRADLLISRPEEKQELLRMNVLGQYYGVETFNSASGKAVGKGMNPEKLKQGLIDTKQYFLSHNRKLYRGTLSLIVGLPHESVESLNNTKQWLIDNWQDQSFMAYPLSIPKGDWKKSSKFSLDFQKHGYEELGIKESNFNGLNGRSKMSRSEVLWKNKYMDLNTAIQIGTEFGDIKNKHQFKHTCFDLSLQFKKPMDIAQLMDVAVPEQKFIRADNVDWYINSKLSVNNNT